MLMLLSGMRCGKFHFFSPTSGIYSSVRRGFDFITCSGRCGGYRRVYRVTVLHEKIESATALVFEPCRVYVSVSSGQNESFLYRATLRE